MLADALIPLVVLAFPIFLMLAMLLMERVERPLRVDEVGLQLEAFLANARPEELETFVSEGYAPALDRYWRRRRRPTAPSRTP
ncbi:MAG TPA: hypothetical protein VNA14_05050 [Mycobacteriales bacterium]|nr:hypothetical protein [Mycobacteriales bacterium]